MGSRVSLSRRAVLVTIVRAINAIFFLTTSSYCLLTYSSFAYQQFIKPHLVNWLTGFVVWHHLAFWLTLILTAWTLVPELRHGRWRGVAWSYLAISAAVGILLLVRPILPQVENNGRGLALALVALLPPIWLAVFDHRHRLALAPSSEGRVFKSALIAAVLVWGCQVVVIPWRSNQTGDITLRTGDFVFGIVTSLVGHVLVFAILAAAVSVVIRVARKTAAGAVEYHVADLGPLYGTPLFVPRDRDPSRRAEPLLIASSYGGVYAVLHDNGSRMYIADGVNGRDYAYDLNGPSPVRIGVTAGTRAEDQQFIRTQVDDIARAYRFAAEP